MVTINQMAGMIMEIAGKKIRLRHIAGPQGVRGRNSDNTLIREQLGWAPRASLRDGLVSTYGWIHSQIRSTAALGPHGSHFPASQGACLGR
jgi:nucleoside-diphosphate-sugar epimerase